MSWQGEANLTSRALRGVLGLVAVFIVLGVSCPAAIAGSYLMTTCNVPDRPASTLAPWYWEAAANVSPVDSCSSGAGFGFYFGGTPAMPRGAASALTLALPPNGPISIRRVRLWTVARLAGTGSALFVGTNSGAPDGQNTNSDLFGPPGGETVTAPHVTSVLPFGTNVFRVLLYCSQSSSDDCYPNSRSVLDVVGAEVTLLESVAPSIAITGGTLGGDSSGTRTVQFAAVDDQSGIEVVELLVDEKVVAERNFGPECPHAEVAACVNSRSGELTIHTATLTNGNHKIRLRAKDAAGNASDSPVRVVEVSNRDGGAGSSGAPSSTQGGRMTAAFAGTSKRTFTVSYGARPKVVGRLLGANGRPVARAAIEVVEKVSGQAPTTARVGETGADGRYAFRLGRHRGSRTVRVQHLDGGQTLSAPSLRLKVRASASLRVALDGVRVRYHGRVLSQRLPTRGVVVHVARSSEGRSMAGIRVSQGAATRRILRVVSTSSAPTRRRPAVSCCDCRGRGIPI